MNTVAAEATVLTPATLRPRVVEVVTVDPMLKGRSLLEARLRARHPAATAAMVRRSVDEAIGVYRDARIRVYLPILIERWASCALRETTG